MELRVDEREWVQFQWPYLLAFLGGEKRVSELAYETGAFTRRREIESPGQLLQLLLTWSVAERSLQETAALAAEAEMADVSDVALMKRFMKAGDWLGSILADMLAGQAMSEARSALRLRVIDASSLRARGGRGTDARLHLSMDLRSHRIDQLELTDAKGGETLNRFTFAPGDVAIVDRGYAHREPLGRVARAGAYFIARLTWSNLPLEKRDGERFDLLEALRTLPEAEVQAFPVQFRPPEGETVQCRMVAIRRSEPSASAARQDVLKERKKHGSVDPRTLEAAGYFFVLTNLPEDISPQSVLQLYELRWQIEMKFKTLKSVIHLGNVPARSPELLRVYVLAKLIVALVIDAFIAAADSFPPWGYPLPATELVAPHAHAS